MLPATELGARLRALRKARGMTLRDVAKQAGVTYASVGQIENGVFIPKLETLDAIVAALGGSLSLQLEAEDPLIAVSRVCPPEDRALAAAVLQVLPRLGIADRRTLQLLVDGWSQSSGAAAEATPASPAQRQARAGG